MRIDLYKEMEASDYRYIGNMLAREMRAANRAVKADKWDKSIQHAYSIIALQKLIMLQGVVPVITYDHETWCIYETLTLAGKTWKI